MGLVGAVEMGYVGLQVMEVLAARTVATQNTAWYVCLSCAIQMAEDWRREASGMIRYTIPMSDQWPVEMSEESMVFIIFPQLPQLTHGSRLVKISDWAMTRKRGRDE